MQKLKVLIVGLLLLFVSITPLIAQEPAGVSADSALKKLDDGNMRYIAGNLIHPHQTVERRKELVKSQHPFAIILSCADSRVPPGVVFDQGLGDLFIVRVAGNVVNDEVLGSIEYAAEHLGTHLVVVLGHQRCGAVDAAVQGGKVPGHIKSLVKAIMPAVERARHKPGDLLDNSVRENIKMVTEKLKSSKPILEHLVHEGKLKIVGAYYSLDDGSVAFSK